MAEIYLAVQPTSAGGKRFVTIKRIRPEFRDDSDYNEFFVTEGQISLQCSHPNLPVAFELGLVSDEHYLAMEYIHGNTLLNALRAAIRTNTRLSLNVPLCVGLGVAAALEHVHNLRDVSGKPLTVIHRDVTPQNIMISTAGMVKLIDFGIVRSAVQRHTTDAGTVKGKFAYMSPEQLSDDSRVDYRADIFSLGVVLWESLASRPLLRGKNQLETMERVRHMQIPDLCMLRPDVPRQLSDLILKALCRNVDQRYQTATEMLSALERVSADCQLVPSVTRLRDELGVLCGRPEWPEIADWDSEGIGHDDTHRADKSPASESSRISDEITALNPTGIDGDAMLQYYLRVSGRHHASDAPTDDN